MSNWCNICRHKIKEGDRVVLLESGLEYTGIGMDYCQTVERYRKVIRHERCQLRVDNGTRQTTVSTRGVKKTNGCSK